MLSPTWLRTISTVTAVGALWAVATAETAAAAEPEKAAAALAVVRPDKGFIDDAYVLTEDGSALLYVNTDGAGWASLHAVGLPARGDVAAPATPAGPAAAEPADKKLVAGASKTKPAAVAATPFAIAPGVHEELIPNLPLSAIKLYLLPEDRVLVVSRDLEAGGVVRGTVYSLRSRGAVPVVGGLGPATDITVGHPASGPAIVMVTRPTERATEYRVQAVSATTLKPLAQKAYKVREGEPRVPTDKGSALPLYFLDDYLTLVAKHDGVYDKKKDMRQPDFVAFVDALTGKVSRSRAIVDPAALLDLSRLRAGHGESVMVSADPETQRYELLAAIARSPTEVPVESRTPLQLPRAARTYDAATLLYQLARPGLLVLSLTVDPVNEQAVAARHADVDTIDLCAVDLAAAEPGPAQRLRTLPGNKRPSSWQVTPGGRLALLRKHKGFARGGTEVEIYDLDLPATPTSAAK